MLNTLTLKQALDKLTKKEVTLNEINSDVNKVIKEQNKKLNVYLTLNEVEVTDSEEKGALAGLPIAVKDNFCTRDLRTTASSTVLDDFKPQYESTVTQKLKDAGAYLIGKTNLDAWAHGSSTETSQYGKTLNPRNMDYLPGGSSGGSAAAVAADMCIAAIGTETAGSVRGPASHCGIVGLKPTYGRVSRYGVIAMASSTDSPGPMTKTVEDAAILLNHMAGHDQYDGTTSPEPIPDFTKILDKDIAGMKIGVIYADIDGLNDTGNILKEQVKVFEKLGAKVEMAKAMNPSHAIGVYTVIQRGEVSSNLGRFDGIRYGNDRSFFGDEAKNRIMLGTYTLSKGYADQYYSTAQKVRTLFIKDFERLFKKYDILISPTVPGYAHPIGASRTSPMFGELEDILMEANSLAGLPGISVPMYHNPKTNLYLGMNIMGPRFTEEKIIQVADAFEKNTKWNSWRNK
jgi:aspartyl-tRNA(Asn)/glutamyl-tRNA(Gln) amidotransferase subunit A